MQSGSGRAGDRLRYSRSNLLSRVKLGQGVPPFVVAVGPFRLAHRAGRYIVGELNDIANPRHLG